MRQAGEKKLTLRTVWKGQRALNLIFVENSKVLNLLFLDRLLQSLAHVDLSSAMHTSKPAASSHDSYLNFAIRSAYQEGLLTRRIRVDKYLLSRALRSAGRCSEFRHVLPCRGHCGSHQPCPVLEIQ